MTDLSTLSESSLSVEPGGREVAHLYVVLDCRAPGRGSTRHSLASLDLVLLGRGEARSASRVVEDGQRRLVLALDDPWTSRRHARLHRSGSRWVVEDLQSNNGTHVNGTRVARLQLEDGDVLRLGRTFLVFRAAQPAGPLDVASTEDTRTLVPALEARYEQLALAVRARLPVMLQGEPGVGKELAARLVHGLSGREGRFIDVNCGAIPKDLVESQFFGREKGAFTGATDARLGSIRAAHGGTLFLDEVGEFPLESQPALLRVLQERVVTPVGADRGVPVDLQLVVATNRDLPELVQRGAFRADLFARMKGFSLTLPPLRERLEDLGVVMSQLLRQLDAPKLTLAPEVAMALFTHGWPMNIRELRKVLEVASALAEGNEVQLKHLDTSVKTPAPVPALGAEDQALKERLVPLLWKLDGNLTAVARELGVARNQVQRWVKRFKLNPRRPPPPVREEPPVGGGAGESGGQPSSGDPGGAPRE